MMKPKSPADTEEFQFLFCWINLLDDHSCRARHPVHEVSILVLLDQPPRLLRRPPGLGFLPVSILVLLDQPPRPYLAGLYWGLFTKFQSLFCWINLRDRHRRRWRRPLPYGFNPCSAGSTSATPSSRRCRTSSRCFNPCSAGSTSANCTTGTTGPGSTRFQSLFCWINL